MGGCLIRETLTCLQSRLEADGTMLVQQTAGYTEKSRCTFHPPVSTEELRQFPFPLPADYKQFLLLHNGGTLFANARYGGGIELLRLDKVMEYYSLYKHDLPDGWYPIAYDNGDMLFIDSNQCTNGEKQVNYLYWSSLIGIDSPTTLHCNFELWLDRLVVAQGTKFWEWNHIDARTFYIHNEEYL